MSKEVLHPGVILNDLLEEKNLSQRDLADRINVAYSMLNNVLKGNRNINTTMAIALEFAGFKKADFWLMKQMKYSLHMAKNDKEIIEKSKSIEEWKELESLVPLAYFKKQHIGINSSDDIGRIYEIYNVTNISELKNKTQEFNPTYFRKSAKFKENKKHVLAWSMLAEYKLKQEKAKKFSRQNEKSLLKELQRCFYNNKGVIQESKTILEKYGIKFIILDRPSQTPVDGKSFMLDNNPAIALSLKYKRLDNFAFTLFHEIGHIFEHLTHPNKPNYRDAEFFVNSSNTDLVEFEANSYASSNLIPPEIFNDFVSRHIEFTDDVIFDFANKHKIHPGIVRGRICHEYEEYYRKRSAITSLNRLQIGT